MYPVKPPKFVAVLNGVREVSLRGLADAGCWGPLMRAADLQLARKNGQAQVLLSAVESRYMGIAFRELSISLLVRHPEGHATGNCYYLACAFNSSRLFAFVERTYFRTPYFPARIEVDVRLPVSFAANRRDGLLVSAKMAPDASAPRDPIRCGDESWEGPIFLPPSRGAGRRQRKWFAARLAGDTQVYPFVPQRDEVEVIPSRGHPVVQLLAESDFAGQEWIVRESAIHARSKTYIQKELMLAAKVEAPALETPACG